MADLGRPRTVHDDVGMLHAVGRDAHGQPVGRAEAETVAAAGAARAAAPDRARDLDAVTLRLGAELIDRRPIAGGEVHAEQAGLRPLPNGQHVMLAAGGAEVDAVAFGGHLFERPDLGVEFRRLMEIANAELDAANAGNPAVRHGEVTSCHRLAGNFAQSDAKGQRALRLQSQPREPGHHLGREQLPASAARRQATSRRGKDR